MLGRIFYFSTLFFALLFLVLSVVLDSWPCGGIFSPQCQAAAPIVPYATQPIGVLICISLFIYVLSGVIEAILIYCKHLSEETQQILSFVSIGASAFGSLFSMSAMLAFIHRYLQSWCVLLGAIGMSLGFSGTYQLVLKLLRDKYNLEGELP